ncbi:MAG: GGDEF domain-containing protein [Phycisphaerales bacterium]|nr:GGDEF domain-containing protein [Phycisphaerales bacterium]
MSSVPSSRRSRRRILSIGPVSFEADLRIEATRTDSVFQALGAIAICPAARPIEAVLLAPDGEELEDLAHSADAIRRLDATIQIVLVSGDVVPPSIAGQFDRQIKPPVTDAVVDQLLDATPQQTPQAPVPPTQATTPSPGPAPPPAEPTRSEPIWTGPVGTSGIDALGDTDLVESMLHDARGVRPVALRLVMQQTNWSDVRIATDHPGAPGVVIQFGGREFGRLQADGATDEAIRPWANWIARWLALDDAQRELREMAFRDELTSAWNRRYLKDFLADAIANARRIRRQLTVMVFDIDDFKTYNDRFGHSAGDTILRQTVRLLGSTIRDGDRVCRIGGDEFAVIFADMQAPRTPGSAHPDSVETIARRFQEQICTMRFPELGLDAPGTLSISGGLASFPWDAQSGDELVHIADQRALESKRRGKNCLTIGPGARTQWPEHE